MESECSRDGSSSEPNFTFAFNCTRFSDRVLCIEITTDPVDTQPESDSVADWARPCKWRRINVLDNNTAADEQTLNGDQPDLDGNQDEDTSTTPSGFGMVNIGDEAANNNDAVVRVKTLHISSIILACKSPFFYKLFTNGMSESKQRHITLRINASEEAGLMELLRFMHSNTLNVTEAPALLDVLIAADKFHVPSCMRYLLNSPITIDSALLYLDLPHTVGAVQVQPLINAARQYLADRYKNITLRKFRKELMAVPLSGIEAILASDDLEVISEDGVYNFALEWAIQKYNSLKERREVLGTRLAPLIRFPYMTCRKLEDVLTCNDFEHEGASKLVLEAQAFKAAESSSLNGRFVPRAYKHVMDMRLTPEECVALFPSGHMYSEAFQFGGQMFFLSAQCDTEEHDPSSHCFSLYLGMEKSCSGSIDVDYEFGVWMKATQVYISQYKSRCTFTPGIFSGCRNLFKVPWTSFIDKDSIFTTKSGSRLYLRATLTVAH